MIKSLQNIKSDVTYNLNDYRCCIDNAYSLDDVEEILVELRYYINKILGGVKNG